MRILLSAAVGTIAVGICCSASAAGLPPVLKNTVIDTGNGNGSALAAGNDTIDSTSIHCASASGCMLIVNGMVEMAAGDAQWAICPTVDGVAMLPTCPIQGLQQTGGATTTTGDGWSNAMLTQGTHTVAAVLSIHHASNLYHWQISYLSWIPGRQPRKR